MRSSKDGLREESRKARADVGLPVAPLASTPAGTATRTRCLRVRIRTGQTPSGIQSPPPQPRVLCSTRTLGPEAPWQHLTHCSSLNSPEFLTHVSSHHPESLWSVSPMIHYTQFVFTAGIYTHFSPRTTPTPQISQTLLYLNPPF